MEIPSESHTEAHRSGMEIPWESPMEVPLEDYGILWKSQSTKTPWNHNGIRGIRGTSMEL